LAAPRLATGLWVQAQLRTCDLAAIPAMVRHRGDPEAGSVIVVHNRLGLGAIAFTRVTLEGGGAGWLRATGPAPVAESETEAYIARAIDRDPDTWVIEIEDKDGRFALDAPVV
jgi:GMP synthase (glutamine-hydrolysing)